MNEHKHGDAYKVEMLRRMLAHETNACEEHYGAWLSHHDVSIKHLTIDAGGIAALIRYYENHDDGQAVMDCQKCEADWTAKHGKPLVQCTALYCRNRCKDRLADYEDAEDALKKGGNRK